MPIDINLLRVERGGDPEKVRESQRRRFANEELVDEVLALDEQWRTMNFDLTGLKKRRNELNKEIGSYRKRKEVEPEELMTEKKVPLPFLTLYCQPFFISLSLSFFCSLQEVEERIGTLEVEVVEIKAELDSKVSQIGNLVDDSGFCVYILFFPLAFIFFLFVLSVCLSCGLSRRREGQRGGFHLG